MVSGSPSDRILTSVTTRAGETREIFKSSCMSTTIVLERSQGSAQVRVATAQVQRRKCNLVRSLVV
jgi:phosphohistidine phosphatase SixA